MGRNAQGYAAQTGHTAHSALQDSAGTASDLVMQEAVVGGGLWSHLVTALESGWFDGEHAGALSLKVPLSTESLF